MAKHFDLSNVLNNEKPTIKIGEKTFTVNDEKSNVLILNSKLEKEDNSIESIDVAIEQLLGKAAVKELNDLSLSMSAYKEIFYTLIACVNDEEIEEVKKRFQK
jgi:hypothetical protein|nr:MAG TPA: hypothetical protein [Caudoviricetes sp.]